MRFGRAGDLLDLLCDTSWIWTQYDHQLFLNTVAGGGTCEDVRIGLTNMGSTPLRATAAEQALRGQALDSGSIASAAAQAAEGTDPPGDLNATPDYKRHLARVLTRRALMEAAGL